MNKRCVHLSPSPEAFSYKAHCPLAIPGWKISQHKLIKPLPHTLTLRAFKLPLASLLQITKPPCGCSNPPGEERCWPCSPPEQESFWQSAFSEWAQTAGPPRMRSGHPPCSPAHSREGIEKKLDWPEGSQPRRVTAKSNWDPLSARWYARRVLFCFVLKENSIILFIFTYFKKLKYSWFTMSC